MLELTQQTDEQKVLQYIWSGMRLEVLDKLPCTVNLWSKRKINCSWQKSKTTNRKYSYTHLGTSQFHHYTFVGPMNYDSTTFYLDTQHTRTGKLKVIVWGYTFRPTPSAHSQCLLPGLPVPTPRFAAVHWGEVLPMAWQVFLGIMSSYLSIQAELRAR